MRALEEENLLLEQVRSGSVALSCKQHELAGAIERVMGERDQLRYQNEQLGLRLFEAEARAQMDSDVRLVVGDMLAASQLRKAAGWLAQDAKIAMVIAPREEGWNYAMSSQTEDVRPVTRALCEAFGGKGGGPKDMTQGVLGKAQESEIREKLYALCGCQTL